MKCSFSWDVVKTGRRSASQSGAGGYPCVEESKCEAFTLPLNGDGVQQSRKRNVTHRKKKECCIESRMQVWRLRTQDNSSMLKKAHLGASQILKFLRSCSGNHCVVAHLAVFVRF